MKKCNYRRRAFSYMINGKVDYKYLYSCTDNGGKFSKVSKAECEQLCKLCKEGQK